MKTLILAYGNPLRGDDGAAWHVAERLRARLQDPHVEIRTMHQLVPELMEDLSLVDRAVFIDAAEGDVPGEVRERRLEGTGTGAFTHFANPAALLAGARRLYGRAPDAWMVTITGADFELSDRLTDPVATQVDTAADVVFRLVSV